ncbi:hypothetical protein [Acutalibacter sp. 1XD8-33]|nr:hypothetical protein [Acutalibacter sp. 1XD8-33]
MGDKVFGAFLRLIITQLKRIRAQRDPSEKDKLLKELIEDLEETNMLD